MPAPAAILSTLKKGGGTVLKGLKSGGKYAVENPGKLTTEAVTGWATPRAWWESFKQAPITTGGLTLGAGHFGAEFIAGPIAGALGPSGFPPQAQEMTAWSQYRRMQMEEVKRNLLRQEMAKSLARIAATDPQLYNEVIAGERLPRGAYVIGRAPRPDLLQELGMMMAEGAVPEQMDPAAEMMQLLQGG